MNKFLANETGNQQFDQCTVVIIFLLNISIYFIKAFHLNGFFIFFLYPKNQTRIPKKDEYFYEEIIHCHFPNNFNKNTMEEIHIVTQEEKAEYFKSLHERSGIFVIANAWDAGSAKILERLGFAAVATTSAGLAFSLAKPDGARALSRDEALANAKSIVDATTLPVSADLENGYGDDAATCAETILLAAKIGLTGCTLEDATGIESDPIYDFELAVERVKGAVKAARSLPFPFMLTARAENYLYGKPDLKDTVRRLKAFADAGANVLYAPGLKTRNEIETIVKAVMPKPVNFLFGLAESELTLTDLEEIGVKRISIGSSLARAAYGAFITAAEEIRSKGTFTFAKHAVAYSELNKLFS